MRKRNISIYPLFFIALLCTEFLYIEIFGGYLRIYHLLAPLVILSLSRYTLRLCYSNVFWALMVFLAVNIIAATNANVPEDALRSLGLLTSNICITIAVALILMSGRIGIGTVVKLLVGVALFSVVFGLVQVGSHHFIGWDLSLSESQGQQLLGGFASGLKTEANTFAKYLNLALLLILPSLLVSPKWKQSLLVVTIIAIGMLMSLTRSALYGLTVTFVFSYLWYLSSGRGRLIAPKAMAFFGAATVSLIIFACIVGGFNEYASYKLAHFFSFREILTGDSASFRLMSQGLLWDEFTATGKTMLIGNGWGQVKFMLGDREMQAGGAEIIVALAYGGIFSGISYLLYQLSAIHAAQQIITLNKEGKNETLYEGIMLGLIGLLITGQISGSMIAPEYWIMLGIAIYCGYTAKVANRKRRWLYQESRWMWPQ